MGMLHGYLYFNVAHEMKLANGASIYVPNVYTMPSLKPLMFFEVLIGKKQPAAAPAAGASPSATPNAPASSPN